MGPFLSLNDVPNGAGRRKSDIGAKHQCGNMCHCKSEKGFSVGEAKYSILACPTELPRRPGI